MQQSASKALVSDEQAQFITKYSWLVFESTSQ